MNKILKNVKFMRENLEQGSLSLISLCEQLRELIYEIHEEFLRQGDEIKAIKIFEELYIPFDKLVEIFRSLSPIIITKEVKI